MKEWNFRERRQKACIKSRLDNISDELSDLIQDLKSDLWKTIPVQIGFQATSGTINANNLNPNLSPSCNIRVRACWTRRIEGESPYLEILTLTSR